MQVLYTRGQPQSGAAYMLTIFCTDLQTHMSIHAKAAYMRIVQLTFGDGKNACLSTSTVHHDLVVRQLWSNLQQLTKWSALWNLGGFNGFQHDHGEEDTNLCLERVPELGHQGEKDAAGQGKGLWDGGCAVLQQTETQILLDS